MKQKTQKSTEAVCTEPRKRIPGRLKMKIFAAILCFYPPASFAPDYRIRPPALAALGAGRAEASAGNVLFGGKKYQKPNAR